MHTSGYYFAAVACGSEVALSNHAIYKRRIPVLSLASELTCVTVSTTNLPLLVLDVHDSKPRCVLFRYKRHPCCH